MSDLISRQDALKPFCVAPDGTRIPEVDCDNFPVEFSVEFIKKHLLSLPSVEAVSREDYHNLLTASNDIDRALRQYQAKDENPSADAIPQSEQYKKGFEDAKRAFLIEYAKESEKILKQNAQLEVMLNIQKELSAEAEDRHYIKIYADDEPSVKAEKLYQICDETQNREVAEWLKEYFPSINDNWIPCSARLPKEDEYVGNVCKYYLIQDEYGDMHVAHLSGRGWETIESVKALGCDVVAWQPLPTPYKGGDDK